MYIILNQSTKAKAYQFFNKLTIPISPSDLNSIDFIKTFFRINIPYNSTILKDLFINILSK